MATRGYKEQPSQPPATWPDRHPARRVCLVVERPAFLAEPENAGLTGPALPFVLDKIEMKRRVNAHSHLTFQHQQRALNRLEPTRFSNWARLVRVQSWVLRFISNCLSATDHRTTGEITPEDFRDAELEIIRLAQRQAFTDEVHVLQTHRPDRADSMITSLNPRGVAGWGVEVVFVGVRGSSPGKIFRFKVAKPPKI